MNWSNPMRNRTRTRSRLGTAGKVTVAGSIVALAGKFIYNDLTSEHSIIKSIGRKIRAALSAPKNTALNNEEQPEIIEINPVDSTKKINE